MPNGRITPNRRTLLGSAAALLAAPALLKATPAQARRRCSARRRRPSTASASAEFEVANILDASVMIDGPGRSSARTGRRPRSSN